MPTLKVVFDSKKSSVIVNDDEWQILESADGTFAAKRLTECTSFTLRFTSDGERASGIIMYVARCPERPRCASFGDYAGSFTRIRSP